MKTPTQAALLDAIRDAMWEREDPGVSVAEYAAAQKLTDSAAEMELRRGVRNGQLLEGWSRRLLSCGQRRRMRVYRPA